MFGPSTSSQLTVQNSMKSTPEYTILMGNIHVCLVNKDSQKYTYPMPLPLWPPVAWSPIINWAPHLLLTTLSTDCNEQQVNDTVNGKKENFP